MHPRTVPNNTSAIRFQITPGKREITCDVDLKDKIIDMISPLAEELAVPLQAIRLTYAGHPVEMTMRGVDYKLAERGIVQVTLSPICPLYKLILDTRSSAQKSSLTESPSKTSSTSKATHALISELKQTRMAIVKQNTPLTITLINHILKDYDDSIDSSHIDLICKMMPPDRLYRINLGNIARNEIINYFLDALDFTMPPLHHQPLEEVLTLAALFATYDAFVVDIKEVLKKAEFKSQERAVTQLTTWLDHSLMDTFYHNLPFIDNVNGFMLWVLTELSQALQRYPKELAALHPVIHQFENELKANETSRTPPAPNKTVRAYFTTLKQKVIQYDIDPNDTIINIMPPLVYKLALPAQAIGLIYAGRRVDITTTGTANNFTQLSKLTVVPSSTCPLYNLILETQSNTPKPSLKEAAQDIIVHAMEKTMAITLLPRHLLPILRAYYEDPQNALDEKKVDVPTNNAPKISTTTQALINELKQTHSKAKMAIVKQNTPLTDTIINYVLKGYDDSIDSSQIDLICKMMSPNRLNQITQSNRARVKIVRYFLDTLDLTNALPNRRPIDDALAFVALFATYEAFTVDIKKVLKNAAFKLPERTVIQLTTLLDNSLMNNFYYDYLPVIGNTNSFMTRVLTHLSRALRRRPKEFAALHPVIQQFENELKDNNAGPRPSSSLSSTLSVISAALAADVENELKANKTNPSLDAPLLSILSITPVALVADVENELKDNETSPSSSSSLSSTFLPVAPATLVTGVANELKANKTSPSSLSSLSSTLSVAPTALVADVEEKMIVFLKLKILTRDLKTTCHKNAGNIIFRSTGPNCPDLVMITHELANQLNQEFKIPSTLAFKHHHMGQPADNIIVSSMEIALGARSITPDQVYFEVSINPNTIANYIHRVTAMPSAAAVATSMANVLQQPNAVIASRPINVTHRVIRKRK